MNLNFFKFDTAEPHSRKRHRMRSVIYTALGMFFTTMLTLLSASAQAGNNSAKSSDGRYEAYIQQIGQGDEEGSGSQSVVVFDRKTDLRRTLVVSRYDDDHKKNLTGLNTPIFSLDGGYIYINTSDPSPYRSAVQQISVRTGQVRFVTAGWALSLMRTGPYRGFLLVQKHVMHTRPQGGTDNPVFLMRPDGRRELMIPNSDNETGEEAVGPWLAARGWHAW